MSIEDALDQPDAVDGAEEETGTEGLIGTEQPGSSPEDDAAAAEFFAGLGIDVPETMREQMGPVEEVPPEPEVEEEVEQPTAQNGWGQRRMGLKRAHSELQNRYQQVESFTNALLQTVLEMQGNGGQVAPQSQPAPAGAPEPAADEPDIDIFEDPDGAINQRAARLFAKEIAPYRAVMAKLLEERQQGQVQTAQSTISQALERARIEYVQQDPGYTDRVNAFQSGYVADLMSMGYNQQESVQALQAEVGGIIQASIRRGINPIKALDTFARRYAPAAAPASAGQPTRQPSERIQAARAAANAGIVKAGNENSTGDIPVEQVTVASLMSGGIKPGAIREVLRRGGRGELFRLMKQAEEAQQRAGQ